VIGHHPHVPQPVEIYRPAADPTRAVPILYSLGNLSTLFSHPAMVLSLVARMRLATGQFRGRRVTRIAALELVPVALLAETSGGREVIRLVRLSAVLGHDEDPELRSYVDEVASYADVVLGSGWREQPVT
jgi:poly-gamma-glutamate synthesis protein (capsule biosynthesis protein)